VFGTLALVPVVAMTACRDDGPPGATPGTADRTPASTTPRPGAGRDRAATTSTSRPPVPLGEVRVRVEPVATELEDPTGMAVRTGDPRLYVAEQEGRIRAVGPTGAVETVADLSARIGAGGERGLLGLTFSPDGTELYVNYTDRSGTTVIEALRVGGDGRVADRGRVLLRIPQPQPNHNGGDLTIGPDGMLWIATGDGGGAGDRGAGHAPEGNGQSLRTLLGKLLRIDPRTDGSRPYGVPPDNPFVGRSDARHEIWAYGLRNPWRFSFDRGSGDLWIADVGQNAWEEVNRLPAGTGAGANFGWNVFEGTQRYRAGDAPGHVPPVHTYGRDGRCSVTGGHVYRGGAIPALRGAYLFSDYCDGRIRALRVAPDGEVEVADLGVRLPNVAAFGQDAAGELYVVSQQDGLWRLVPG